MRCPLCQRENEAGAKFCEECAAPLARACGKCGRQLSLTAKFCPECAYPTGLSAAPPPAQRFGSPEAYTPRHLAEKILTSRSALEGERKQVTVLFADLKGSLELLADRDPEEARKILDPVLERMMEAVHRYEGTVNQVMGDGIMALFGAPLAHEDHAVRACYAALRMQDVVKHHSEEVRRTIGVPVSIRVGLNSGEVVVRAIGSDLHMDYTAVGQTVHLAARMEQAALPGSILISADTLRLAEGYVQVRPLGPVNVKGFGEPVEMYEVTGAGPVRTRLQASAARGLTRFVGRRSELDHLREALEWSHAGHGQVVTLVGEPGVGKSRLVWEFTRSHRTQGWLVLESTSVSYGKATPYLPVSDLLRAYFQIEARDDGRKIRERLTGKLLTLDRTLEPALPAFLALLDVPDQDPQWQALDPVLRRQQTLDAVKHLFLRESQVQPLLLVFEDLHWIDTETQALLDTLGESLPTARMLLLVNYRPEYQHGWGSKTYYSQLRLDPLPPETAGELLQALVGDDVTLSPLKRLLIERTEGNPFFLEESVRTLIETKVLVGERGAYRLAKPLDDVQVPATVEAVLAARIDRLSGEDKRFLQVAAVIGQDVPFALLQAIAELPEEGLRQGLAHLRAAEFLYESSLFPEVEYTFKHALTHEVAYRGLLQERRQALHARCVEVLEQLGAERMGEQVERLAHHALAAGAWDKAAAYLRQAGTRAIERSAHREALTFFEQALAALAHLPESRDRLELGVDVRLDLRDALLGAGEYRRIAERLSEAEEIATALDDRRRLGWASTYLALEFSRAGEHDRAIECAQRALAIAAELGDRGLHAMANYFRGVTHLLLGDYPRAAEILGKTVAHFEGERARERLGLALYPSVNARSMLAMTLSQLGEFVDAIAQGEEAVRTAEALDHVFSLSFACLYVGSVYLNKGDVHKSFPYLERSFHLAQAGRGYDAFGAGATLSHAYALAGRIADALPLLDQYASRDLSETQAAYVPRAYHQMSEAYLAAGKLDAATRMAVRLLDFTRPRRERGRVAHALWLLGEIAGRRDPPEVESAEAHYRQALTSAEELGMRPLQAHCHLGLGKLCWRTGKWAQAQEHLTTAAAMYREMDMGFWLAQAEAALKERGPRAGR